MTFGEHPQALQLLAFTKGDLNPTDEERRALITHLLSCPSCRHQVANRVGFAPRPVIYSTTEGFGFTLRRAQRRVRDHFELRERAAKAVARELWEANASTPRTPPPAAQRGPEIPLAHLRMARATHFLGAAKRYRRSNPEMTLLMAAFARGNVARIDPSEFPEGVVNDLHAQCWTEIANAHRMEGRLDIAERCFHKALDREQWGNQGEVDLADHLLLVGSLLNSQRKPEEAKPLLLWAASVYAHDGERHLAGRTYLKLGLLEVEYGNAQAATTALCAALSYLDIRREPALQLVAFHNLIVARLNAGEAEDAAGHLKSARPLYDRLGSAIDHVRYQWLEGKIFLAREAAWRAEISFQKALKGFRERDLFYQAALVQLDLCHVWFLEGRTRDCQVAAAEALQIFQSMNISREALAAVILLEQSLREERATVAILRSAAELAARGEGGR